jgi:hypothetical protein
MPVVSDFGIALAVSAGGGGRLTETGLSLGTPHYMSPEQATGDLNVGPSTDIYALGCVLYEMLIGEPPYTGSTPQAVLGRIIAESAPSAQARRPSVPVHVDAAIARSLEKIPADRFVRADRFGRALHDSAFRHGRASDADPAAWIWKGVAMGASTVAVLLVLILFGMPRTRPVARFPSPFLPGQAPTGSMRFTPDGSALVYMGATPGGPENQLWIRRFDDLEARPIPDTRHAGMITFAVSPDGREIAFVPFQASVQPVLIAPLDGGSTRRLGVRAFGVSAWTPGDDIYFAGGAARIQRVAASGGPVETLTDGSELEEYHVGFLPLEGGERGILEVRSQANPFASGGLWVVDADTGDRRLLTAGFTPTIAPSGQLLFVTASGTLMAAPFDEESGSLTGEALVALEHYLYREQGLGGAAYDVSQSGDLTYLTGQAGSGDHEFVWVNRDGRVTPIEGAPWFQPGVNANRGWKLSPDHGRVAFQRVLEGNVDIFTLDLQDGTVSRFTFDPARDWSPRWSHDGSAITFFSTRGTTDPLMGHLWTKPSDGSGEPRPLVPSVNAVVGVWGPEGEWLVLRTVNSAARPSDIVALRPARDTAPTLRVQGDSRKYAPAISPDGRWLAYTSDETGDEEVWVRPFPSLDMGKWLVSTSGGSVPVWAHDGSELFFFDPGARSLMSAEIRGATTVEVGRRRTLFTLPADIMTEGDFYDVAGDDQRFLMARLAPRGAESERLQTVLVQNFVAELARLEPRSR